jgi:hypothetical protein
MPGLHLWSAYAQGAHMPRAEYSAYAGRVSCSLTSANWIVSTPTGLKPAPPLSAQPRTLWSWESWCQTLPPPDQPAPPGKCGCGTPPGGVGKCRRVWRVWQKVLSLCGGNGAQVCNRAIGYGSTRRRTGGEPLMDASWSGLRRRECHRRGSLHTATATPKDGRPLPLLSELMQLDRPRWLTSGSG